MQIAINRQTLFAVCDEFALNETAVAATTLVVVSVLLIWLLSSKALPVDNDRNGVALSSY